MSNSVVPAEVARFGALASRWWDPRGPMAPLHAMNPLRVGWIDGQIKAHLATPPRNSPVPPPHLCLLDVGCGAGLAAEALARRGYNVTGIDAAAEVIGAATVHAQGQPLALAYRVSTAESLLAEEARYDVITALEVIEHVADPQAFVNTLSVLLKPGGLLVLSTLNRTRRAYLTAKIGAEYLFRLLPAGTHDWSKFLSPAEVAAMLRQARMRTTDVAGMRYAPLTGRWRTSPDTSVNYILAARKD
jgi:2-polyprenyl-6-hydroxyphenyl methylase/3-demethylubiquinone-9 3-methyltransferase